MTKRAVQGYDRIINYLETHWTEKEIRNFIHETNEFFELLSEYPELLQKTRHFSNVFRGPINKFTMLTYRVRPRKNQIEILSIRGTRQRPLK